MEDLNFPIVPLVNCSSNRSGLDSPSSSNPLNFPLELPILQPSTISYNDFFVNHLIGNKPCLFTKEVTSMWPSRRDWVNSSSSDELERIDFDFLQSQYGDVTVAVTRIQDEMSMEYGEMNTESMTFRDYIDYWKNYIENGYPSDMPCLYLKDWHIVKDSKNRGYEPYTTPSYFMSDWLNEISDEEDDDYRFAYMGPKGSWTPFHADVYGSNSWSANVIGQKKWRLYSPGKEKRFLQTNGKLKYDFGNPGTRNEDFIEIIQSSGEIIFVPSGWYHIVWNESDTISINHNWMNGANICYIWSQLVKAMNEVKVEIEDLKSMDGFLEQCQMILKANHGMDYEMFVKNIEKILLHRQSAQDNSCRNLGSGQVTFDLYAIRHLVEMHMVKEKDAENWKQNMQRILATCTVQI